MIKNYFKQWTLKKHFFASIIVMSLFFFTFMFGDEASAIGVIGGADGPTAVFIASPLILHTPLVYIVMFVILMILYKPLQWFIKKLGIL